MGTRSSYPGLIRLQKLNKARHEMELARLNAEANAIGEENAALFKIQNERFQPDASFVPVDIIIKRLENNRARQDRLAEQLVRRKQDLLKVSRTLDILNDRLRAQEHQLQRAEAAMEMDEYISQLLGKASS